MHVTTKEVDQNGVHILTSVIEGDGALAIASEEANLTASVVSVKRTASGGVQVQTSVTISEPAPASAPTPLTAQDEAVAYFVSKGFTKESAEKQVARFGVYRIFAQRKADNAAASQKLDEELSELLSSEGQKQ
jgi:hypothetical protein